MTQQDREQYLDFVYFLGEGRQEKKLNEYMRYYEPPYSEIGFAQYIIGDDDFIKSQYLLWSNEN